MKQLNNSSNGFLIVFEGIDGSGKTTQVNLLSQYLKEKKIDFEIISFPQYGKNEYVDKIESYLKGEQSFDSYSIAKVYAEDRKTARDKIKNWLDAGKLVIANRYVSSSKAHLGANLPKEKRNDFIKWIDQLEYNENKMPKEDLTILLRVNPLAGQKNVAGRHTDLHEENLKHLQEAHQIYLELAKTKPNWYVVDCMKGSKMESKENIQSEIVKIVEKKYES